MAESIEAKPSQELEKVNHGFVDLHLEAKVLGLVLRRSGRRDQRDDQEAGG